MKDNIRKMLMEMSKRRASDLHITADSPLIYRIDGELVRVDGVLSRKESEDIIHSMLSEEQLSRLEKEFELDFCAEIEGIGRFRCNAFRYRGKLGCAIRLIPLKIMGMEECGLPVEVVRKFCTAHKGLVLVTGATGSGKSTTLAAMVDHINSTRNCHIVTVEDPVEFIYDNNKSLIHQRQLYEDTHSFNNALRHVLREDPNVILIGELRDLDTIRQALMIADTGHLVLGTLHTSDSIQTINRIVDVFPSHQQQQVRTQLSFVLVGILAQQLLPRKKEPGMALAAEVLVANPAIRSLIRDAKEHQIYSVIQTSQKIGMKTMNQALYELYSVGTVNYDDVISRSSSPEELSKMIG